MTDIHCHIIFGADDGSGGIEESVKMSALAYSGGTRRIIATPHCNIPDSYRNYWDEDMLDRLKAVNHANEKAGVKVEILPGNEIFCAGRFISLIKNGKLRTLNDSRYALVEFDFEEYADSAYMKLSQLASEGYVPVVAHPERYGFVCEDFESAVRMKDIGCLLQVNKGSLKGSFGHEARQASLFILGERLADFVASDGHSPYMRTPYLADAEEFISEEFSPDYAKLLLEYNPESVVEDRIISGF